MHGNRWGFASVSLSDTSKKLNGERSLGKATGHLQQHEEKKKKAVAQKLTVLLGVTTKSTC